MKRFFTRATQEAAVWCKPCDKQTQWKITNGRPQYCLVCFDKLEKEHASKPDSVRAYQEGFDWK